MTLKSRTITAVILTVVLIALAVLVWANQTKRITIWGADTVTVEKRSTQSAGVIECPNPQVVTGYGGIGAGMGAAASGFFDSLGNFISNFECGYVRVNGTDVIRTVSGSIDVKYTQVDPKTSNYYALCPAGTFISGFVKGTQTTTPVTQNAFGLYSGVSVTTNTYSSTPSKITCVKLTAPNGAIVAWSGQSSIKLVGTGTHPPDSIPRAKCGNNSTAIGVEQKNGLNLQTGSFSDGYITCSGQLSASGGTVPIPPPVAQDTTPPSSPLNLTAQALSETEIDLNWKASSDNVGVAGYKLYNADTNELIKNTSSTSYKVTGAKCGTIYRYFVVAYDNAGNHSNRSNVAEATTLACTPEEDKEAPTAPGNLRYSDPTASGNAPDCWYAELTWEESTDNVGVTGYDVYNAENNELITTTNETRYNLTGLKENTKYSYYIKAHDAAGNSSEASNTKSFTTNTCPAQAQSSSASVSSLVSTGAVLWFNIGIALVFAGIITYFLLKKRPNY